MAQHIETEVKAGTRRLLAVSALLVGGGLVAAAILSFPSFRFFEPSSTGGVTGLKVADVTRAFADIDQYGPFVPLTFNAGSTTVYQLTQRVGTDEAPTNGSTEGLLSISRTAAGTNSRTNLWEEIVMPPAAGAATPFSVEIIPSTGLPTQMVVVRYRTASDRTDRSLTVCIGQTDANKVYVARDGSTYTDARFRYRTTTEACSSIVSRGFRPTKITGGTVVAEPSTMNDIEWSFVRFFIGLARFQRTPSEVAFEGDLPFVGLPSETPLYAGVNAAPGEQTPNAMFRLQAEVNGAATSLVVCFPSLTVDPETGGPVFYFDDQGTPYHDILLQTRAMTESCPSLVARMLSLNGVANGQTSPALPEFSAVAVVNRGAWVGVTSGTLWQPVDNLPPRNVPHPLILLLSGQGVPTDIPTAAVTLTDNAEQQTRLCFLGGREATVLSWQFVYYYDTGRRAYRDMFLTDPVSCTMPSSGGGGGPSRLPVDGIDPIALE